MCLKTFLILSGALCIINAIYIPSPKVLGKIDGKSLLNQTSTRNVTYTFLNITELAKENGYAIEEHKVTTEDGYILGLHRLKSNSSMGVPVFLMHGLIDSSDSWILQGSNSLAYQLINEGFDVWMGNARGNKYSSSHIELSPKEEKFWTFSWEEIGAYDLPAMIDHILNTTDQRSLYYVGHSQGTTTFFVMNALKPEYRGKIKMMFALSPIAFLSHAQSPLLRYLSTIPVSILQYFQSYAPLSLSKDFLHQIYASMCNVMNTGCGSMFEMVYGTNHFVNKAFLPVIIGHMSTSSVKQFLHYWQLYQSGRFCRFDYGWWRNMFTYGQFRPPHYNLSEINAPIILFFSANDWLCHPSDVSTLKSQLPNVYTSYYSQYFSHIDYLYASVAKEAIYDKIIAHIHDYEQY